MTRFFVAAAIATLILIPTGAANAANNPQTSPQATGQPNQSCEATPNTPGASADAPGSAFNTSGVAGTKYAGQQPQNSKNPNSVSQYDVACSKQPA